jgi:gluconate 2-dehydrogenase alpha chain
VASSNREVDAVIIGLGWAGAILAKELTDAGLEVLALERGSDRALSPGRPPVDELEGSVHRKYVQSLDRETVTIRHRISERAVPYRQIGSFKPGTGVGGAGAHWSGSHFRALPEDLELLSTLTERFGSGFIPSGMSVRDFPVSFEELEPHFDHFERVCGTSGRSGVLRGERREGGNPFEGSRSREFPLPPTPHHLGTEQFYKASRNAGYHPFPMPASNASQPYVNPYGCTMQPCRSSGFCSDFVCPNDAKASPNLNILPALRGSPNFSFKTRAQVLKVNLDKHGSRAIGVTFLDADGNVREQRAALVLLCASPLYNTHLMLLSGIGPPYDPVTRRGTIGKNYTYQNVARVYLFFGKDTFANGFIGIGGGGAVIDDLNGNRMDSAKLGFIGGGIIAARQPGMGPVRGIPVPPGTPSWGSEWKRSIVNSFRHHFYWEVQASCMPYADRYLDLDPNYRDAFGRPLLRMTFDWHDNETAASRYLVDKALAMARSLDPISIGSNAKKPGAKYDTCTYQTTHNNGGATMGDDPSESALNRYLQSWDVPNVFVVGANAFPQTSAYNPTGLVGALAYWSARAIRTQYIASPGPLVPT